MTFDPPPGTQQGPILPAHVTLFDSCPGVFHFLLTDKPICSRLPVLSIPSYGSTSDYTAYLRPSRPPFSAGVHGRHPQWGRIHSRGGAAGITRVPKLTVSYVCFECNAACFWSSDTMSRSSHYFQAKVVTHSQGYSISYAKEDTMIWWEDVEWHARIVETERGLDMKSELFVGSEHVVHADVDSQRYWAIAKGLSEVRW